MSEAMKENINPNPRYQMDESRYEYYKKYLSNLFEKQKEAGMLSLDLEETIPLRDVPIISVVIREMNIEHFTISSQQASMQEIMLAFSENLISLDGVGTILNRLSKDQDFGGCVDEQKIAFLMTVR